MAKTTKARVSRLSPDEIRPGSGMSEVAVRALLVGLDLGWDATEMRNGQIRLSREYEGRLVQIMLPTNQRSIKESVSRSWMRKVFRYADPMKMAFLTGITEGLASDDQNVVEQAYRQMDTLRIAEIFHDRGALGKYMSREIDLAPDEPEPEPEPVMVEPEPEPEVQVVEQPAEGPQVTKIRPWIARHTMRREGGEVYESRAVLERKWNDGTVDYICSKCDYVNVEPRRVAAHYGGKHGKEDPASVTDVTERYVDPERSWTPTQRQAGRIHRLAKELNEAAELLEAEGKNVTAEALAEWIVKHRDAARDGLSDETTPLTAEQTIERIRRMVDGGAYADLMARIESVEATCDAKVAEAREQLAQHDRGALNAVKVLEERLRESEEATRAASEQVAAAEAVAQEANERWTALRDIVNG